MRARRTLVVFAALGLVALVLVAALAAIVGVRGTVGGRPEAQAPGGSTTHPTEPPQRRGTATPPTTASSPLLGPIVTVTASSEDDGPLTAIGGLRPDSVLRMRVTGFPAFALGRASQCVAGPPQRCGNLLEVQFREDGTAAFQYLVTTTFAPAAAAGGCRAVAVRCSIVVQDVDGEEQAELTTVFHDELPTPGDVRVEPSTGLVPGQRVTVRASGLHPGIVVHAALCAIDRAGRRCAAIGDGDAMSVGADGTAATTVTIGDDSGTPVRCHRSRSCVVTVLSDTALVRVSSAGIRFASPPGPDYDPARVATGLAIAVVLLAVVAWLVRRTDWSPVGEEAAPEIDDADYADLDAIIAALPPEEDIGELVSRH